MDLDEVHNALIGSWRVGVDHQPIAGSPLHSLSEDGAWVMRYSAERFNADLGNRLTGDGASGRWVVKAAADHIVLHLRTLQVDRGWVGAVQDLRAGPWAVLVKPAIYLLGRLIPPEEYLVVDVSATTANLRSRPTYFGRSEHDEQWIRDSRA